MVNPAVISVQSTFFPPNSSDKLIHFVPYFWCIFLDAAAFSFCTFIVRFSSFVNTSGTAIHFASESASAPSRPITNAAHFLSSDGGIIFNDENIGFKWSRILWLMGSHLFLIRSIIFVFDWRHPLWPPYLSVASFFIAVRSTLFCCGDICVDFLSVPLQLTSSGASSAQSSASTHTMRGTSSVVNFLSSELNVFNKCSCIFGQSSHT